MAHIKIFTKSVLVILFVFSPILCYSQETIEEYHPFKKDSIQIGNNAKDFLPFIQKGYTLLLPKSKKVNGVLIFLEDSGIDKKNTYAKSMYANAEKNGFAVVSVSTEIPLDFYFNTSSILDAHHTIERVFKKYELPNKNVFFLGGSLVGHRAMRYIQFVQETNQKFQLAIEGLVISNFTLDWTRKWHQHKREIRIKRNNLWEPTFMNYMLETHLKGTPETIPEAYHNFSAYSYFDPKKRNLKWFKNLAIRGYIEPAIKYRLTKKIQSLYENSSTDIVGFLAELQVIGNTHTDLIVIHPKDNPSQIKTASGTWKAIDKKELMSWIVSQTQR